MYLSVDSLEADVLKNIEQGDFSVALDLIIQFVQYVIDDPKATAVIFGSERLDQLCLALGKAVAKNNFTSVGYAKKSKDGKCIVTLASHLERYGGHTYVIEDLIRAQSDKIHTILLTDYYNKVDENSLIERFSPIAELRIAPRGSSLIKMEWLLAQLEEINPLHIFLFNHNQDAGVIAAVQPWLDSSRVIFYHHADHTLCLGVHLPGAIHIDPHNIGYDNCRTHEGLKSNRYLPLAVPDRGCRPTNLEFLKNSIVRTCSSGTSHKFHQPYPYLYSELIPKALALHGGIHFHIGDLSDSQFDTIRLRLKKESIDMRRFVHIPWVSSLWSSLIENRIDLYISSFPLGGGRAAIEAMGSGTPLLIHESFLSRFYGGADLAYRGALVWRNPIEFQEHIGSLEPKTLSEHSKWARRHYQVNHLPQIMASELKHICAGEEVLTPPPLRSYIPDNLQKYLHMNFNGTLPLKKMPAEIDRHIVNLNQTIDERNRQIDALHNEVDTIRNEIEMVRNEINVLYHSTSWKVTAPLRSTRRFVARLISRPLTLNTGPAAIKHGTECYQVKTLTTPQIARQRVVHVIGNFMTGGSSRLVVDLFEHLGHLYEQEVVTQYNPSPPNYAGIPIHEFAGSHAQERFVDYLRRYQPELIHIHYWEDTRWYGKMINAAREFGCKVIENVNTPTAPHTDACISRYIYVSDYVKNRFGNRNGSSFTIYPGSNFRLFYRDESQAIPDNCIGMVYRLDIDKLNKRSIDIFINVVQRRPQTKVIIVGGGHFLEPYKSAVKAQKVENAFNFTGFVPYEKLPEFYAQMSLFIAPVWKESFGQVSPFAMSMGIPVVGYNVGALAEIIGDASLLAARGDSDALAEIIVGLLDDKERRQHIGYRNRVRAHKLFSVESMIDSYTKLYQELIGKNQ